MLVEFVVAHQAQHTVVFVLVGRDGRCRVQEPVGTAGPLDDPGQFRGVQAVQDAGDGGVRGVRVGGEDGQGLDAAVPVVAFQEPDRAVVVVIDVVDDADQGPGRRGGDDGWLIQAGEMGGVGAEEGRVLSEAQDAAVEVVVAVLLLGRVEQPAVGHEGVGGRVQLVGGQGRKAGGCCGRGGRCGAGSCAP
ncbi:hypothetical protein [Streptomyces sp. NPDC096068]|uniref:hypothetical protein n=1 Tax=Streptomyces sp. NPDC096068 TaxID=3155424 RepID=UPI003328A483